MQPTDDCEYRDILTTVEKLGQLVLEAANIGLEVVTLSYFDREKVVIVLLGFSARGVLSKERLSYLLEIEERMWQQGVEPIQSHALQA